MTLPYHTPLSADQQSSLGIDPPAPFAMADKVRFSELDVLNHVNNAVYFEWFERVRVLYTQHFGLSRSFETADGPRIVIRSGAIHYRQEMLLHEDYVVTCGCTAYRKTSFTMHQEIWAGGTQRASFDCVVVLLHPDGSGRCPIPEEVRARFDTVDGARFEG
ncbi:MAG: thioesterase family protein [Pseudomonadota bacterium]